MGMFGGNTRAMPKVARLPMATPVTVTIMIWIITARATMALGVPMALSIPIWGTFCSI